MRIAQVAPLYESVPPQFYGGTERVVSYLTEELVSKGHDVTLFASGDSKTSARLISPCERALRLNQNSVDKLASHFTMLEMVMESAHEFDVLHFHLDYMHFPFSKLCCTPHLTTLHGRLDIPELPRLYQKFPHVPVASISWSQREPLPWINLIGNVYHGLPADSLLPNSGQGEYLAFLGRIAPEKRVDRAIQIAIESGIPLKIAAKVDPTDREYYAAQIKPLLGHPNIEYLGEIREEEKAKFLGDAFAHLFPIDWREPFGLCMIEAMACGTPSIAFDRGSVREVLTDRVTGIVVNNVEEAVLAVQQVASLSRVACRKEFESRFTASHMADKYVTLYESLSGGDALSTPPAGLDTTLLSGTASV